MSTAPIAVEEYVRAFVASHATGDYQEYLFQDAAALQEYRAARFDAAEADPTFTVKEGGEIAACCRFTPSEWDSQTLGVWTGRVCLIAGASVESKSRAIRRMLKFADSERYELVTARVDASDNTSMCALQAAGFRQADAMAVYLWDRESARPKTRADARKTDLSIEPIDRFDVSEWGKLQPIADGAFAFSRISTEPRFSPQQVTEFYSRYFRDMMASEDGVRLAAHADGAPVGFAVGTVDHGLAERLDGGLGYLSLIAVNQAARSRGIGRRLLDEFLSAMAEQVRYVEIATQLQNHAALNLYAAAGLKIAASLATFHRWRQ